LPKSVEAIGAGLPIRRPFIPRYKRKTTIMRHRRADDDRRNDRQRLRRRGQTQYHSSGTGRRIDQVVMPVCRKRDLVPTGTLDGALERTGLVDQAIEPRQRDAFRVDQR